MDLLTMQEKMDRLLQDHEDLIVTKTWNRDFTKGPEIIYKAKVKGQSATASTPSKAIERLFSRLYVVKVVPIGNP